MCRSLFQTFFKNAFGVIIDSKETKHEALGERDVSKLQDEMMKANVAFAHVEEGTGDTMFNIFTPNKFQLKSLYIDNFGISVNKILIS